MKGWSAHERGAEGALLASLTPYEHWWMRQDRTRRHEVAQLAGAGGPAEGPFVTIRGLAPSDGEAQGAGPDDFFWHPAWSRNPQGDAPDALPADLSARIGPVPADAVIVGIIDDAIALGHRRFGIGAGPVPHRSRFLAAWQQGAEYQTGAQPLGQVLLRPEIESLIAERSHGDWFDDVGFNRAVDPARRPSVALSPGARGLEQAAAHGTQVLDMACGEEPGSDEAQLLRRPILAVNLPSRRILGLAGAFLEPYCVLAMQWIVAVADRLWAEQHPQAGPGGFPVVLNLSYGHQAGTKTGTSRIERAFRQLQKARPGGAPLHLVMPTGNDNLARSNLRWRMEPGVGLDVPWRLGPEDQTSNFVEIWVDLEAGEMAGAGAGAPVAIAVTAPGAAPDSPDALVAATYRDDPTGTARVYCDLMSVGEAPALRRLRYVVATRPTLDPLEPGACARAGLWHIRLDWAEGTAAPRNVYVNIQIDIAPLPGGSVSRRGYFDSPSYRTHDPAGRLLDTYVYPLTGQGADNLEPADRFGPVQRKGSQNALGNHEAVLLIAGHRLCDGRPADVSATTYPLSQQRGDGKAPVAPQAAASFPVDLSPGLTGLRAAGPRSGSTARLRGTSFAAPQATRWCVAQLLAGLPADRAALEAAAADADAAGIAEGRFAGRAAAGKIGAGRMPLTAGRGRPRGDGSGLWD